MNSKSFSEYINEQDLIDAPQDTRGTLETVIGFLESLEPKDISECQDLLLGVQKTLERILSGGE